MTLKQIASLGKELIQFLWLFRSCFRSTAGFALARIYLQGLLSDLERKNVEAIALEFDKSPRTLQRFLESVKWNETGVRDQCQRLIAREHAHAEAIGCIDESGTAKSGTDTVGVGRQWLGSCGKVDNGVVGVHLSYYTPEFRCLLDSQLYLPEDWAADPERRKKTTCRPRWCSAPSRRSPWLWSITRWPTACASRPGRSTNSTDVIRRSWTVWNNADRYSSARCRPTFMAG
jgi:SRSO17 transposase